MTPSPSSLMRPAGKVKLTLHNYHEWAQAVKSDLLEKKAWYVTNGTIKEPVDKQSDKYFDWLDTDQVAQGILTKSLSNHVLEKIQDKRTANEIWTELKKLEKGNLLMKALSLRELFTASMEQTGDLDTHLTKMTNSMKRLRDMGFKLDDVVLVCAIICSLPPKFNGVINAIRVKDAGKEEADEVTSAQLCTMLLEANAIHGGHQQKKSEYSSQGNSKGHAKKAIQPARKNPECKRCGETGHWASQCPHNLVDATQKLNAKKAKEGYKGGNKAKLAEKQEKQKEQSGTYGHAFIAKGNKAQSFYIDSGASGHMTDDISLLRDYEPFGFPYEIGIAEGGRTVDALGKGVMDMMSIVHGKEIPISFSTTFVPKLGTTLISLGELESEGYSFRSNQGIEILHQNEVIIYGKLKGNMYEFRAHPIRATDAALKAVPQKASLQLWHRRFGHADVEQILSVAEKGHIIGMHLVSKEFGKCEPCLLMKATKVTLPQQAKQPTKAVGEILHMDIQGPLPAYGREGERYSFEITDDFSNYTAAYPIKRKDEVGIITTEFIAWLEKQAECQVKCLVVDGAKEFLRGEVERVCKKLGIELISTAPYRHELHGKAERKHLTLLNAANSMLKTAHLPEAFWPDAIKVATYCQNRLISRTSVSKITGYEGVYKQKPNAAFMRVFGCIAYVHIPREKRNKLQDRSAKCVFIGYEPKCWRFYNMDTGEVLRSVDAKFFEQEFANEEEFGDWMDDDPNSEYSESDRSSFSSLAEFSDFDEETVDKSPRRLRSRLVEPTTQNLRFNESTQSLPVLATDDQAPTGPQSEASRTMFSSWIERAVNTLGQLRSTTIESANRAPTNSIIAQVDAPTAMTQEPVNGIGEEVSDEEHFEDAALPSSSDTNEVPGNGMALTLQEHELSVEEHDVFDDSDFEDVLRSLFEQPNEESSHKPSLRRSGRTKKPTHRFIAGSAKLARKIISYENKLLARNMRDATKIARALVFVASYSMPKEPRSLREAMNRKDWDKWLESIFVELRGLILNKTWRAENLPEGRSAIKSKLVFKLKENPDGSINKYKARLVALGNSQKAGEDYTEYEVFAPVLRHDSLRIFCAAAAKHELKVRQIDVEAAYLHSEIKEEIYLDLPKEVRDLIPELHDVPGQPRKYCRLVKGLYGLKQSANRWNAKLRETLFNIGFNQSKVDPCMYYRRDENGLMLIGLYVDDMLLASATDEDLDAVEKALPFKVKRVSDGPDYYIIGNEVRFKDGKCYISQGKYIRDKLEEFELSAAKGEQTPMGSSVTLSKLMEPQSEADKHEMQSVPYRSAVGSLIHASVNSRFDISHAVCSVARFFNNPGQQHWTAVKRIYRYLKRTQDAAIVFDCNAPDIVEGYVDASYACSIDDRKSITGYLFTYCGGPIAWSAKRQQTVAASTTEAEYMAACDGAIEGLWIKHLLEELGLWNQEKLTLYEDNKNCIRLAENPMHITRAKHIDIKYHFLRDKVESGEIDIRYLATTDMIADLLTKPLQGDQFYKLRTAAGMISHVSTCGGVLESGYSSRQVDPSTIKSRYKEQKHNAM